MTKKSKSKNEAKKKPAPKKPENELNKLFDAMLVNLRANAIDKRKELLAQVAGSIAAGMVTAPSPSISTPSSMATAAVDIADEILKKAGIPSSAETVVESSSSGDAQVGAAS